MTPGAMSCCREEKGRTDHCRQPRDLFVHDVYPFSEVDQVVEGSNLVLFKGGEAANRAENSAGCLRSKLGEKAMGRLRKLRRRPWALKYHWAAGMGDMAQNSRRELNAVNIKDPGH